jgi:hypothetical protein
VTNTICPIAILLNSPTFASQSSGILLLILLYLRDFPLFYVCPAIKNCPSARCASAANVVCRDFDVFTRQNISLEHILL